MAARNRSCRSGRPAGNGPGRHQGEPMPPMLLTNRGGPTILSAMAGVGSLVDDQHEMFGHDRWRECGWMGAL